MPFGFTGHIVNQCIYLKINGGKCIVFTSKYVTYYLEEVILFCHVRYPTCYEAIRQALWIGLKVVDFMIRPLKIFSKITRL